MRKFTLLLFAALLISTGATAQALTNLTPAEINTVDLTGRYEGTRYQYSPDKKSIAQSFVYQFDLQQAGNIVTGTSTIIKADGNYADMKLRGMVIADKLYFEEYEIIHQAKGQDMVWCYKSGALNIKKDGGQLKLTGATDSYMADYYLPCSGGTTDLTKADNSNNFKKDATDMTPAAAGNNNLAVAPNPFTDATGISYSISNNANVTLEVYDISGRLVKVLENNLAKNAGAYNVNFSAKNAGLAAGVLIAKLTVNGQACSSEMVQMR
jgi:hypothetical protein